jgi:hypothetical protein
MANSVVINVIAKVGGLNEVEKFKSKLNGLTTTKGFKSAVMGVGMGAGMAAFNALGSAISGATDFMQGAVQAAMDEETSLARLNTALEANVRGWDGNTKAIEDTIAARLKLGFSDDEQRESLAILVAKTGDYNSALAISGAAMDLARLKGIELAEATKAISLGMSGSGRALKELGINVKDYASGTEILGAIQEKAAGQAEAFGNTTAGAMLAAQVAIDEASETIGVKMLPIIKKLAFAIRDELVPAVETLDKTLTDFGNLKFPDSDYGPFTPIWEFVNDLAPTKTKLWEFLDGTQQRYIDNARAGAVLGGALGQLSDNQMALRASMATPLPALTGASMAPIIASASEARDALRSVTDAFKDVSRSQRDSLISTAYDAKRLPEEQILAQSELKAAQKAYRKGETEDGKRFTREQKAEAKIRVYNAAESVNELNRKSGDFTADYGKTGVKLGEALMIPFHSTIYAWTLKINALLRSVGGGFTTPVTPSPTTPRTGPSRIYEPPVTGSGGTGTTGGKTGLSVTVNTSPVISARDVERATVTRARYTTTAGSVI